MRQSAPNRGRERERERERGVAAVNERGFHFLLIS